MEADQVRVQEALQKLFPLEEDLEDCRCRERLVEIEANVRLDFFTLPNVLGNEHVLVTVHPDGLSVEQLTDLMNSSGQTMAYSTELGKVLRIHLQMITRIDKIVHVRPN